MRDRWAHASRTLEGCGAIDAWMPPLDFTIWQNEFQRLIDHLHAADVAEATERLGRRPLSGELAHDGAQRRSDAMLLMAQRSAAFDGEVGPSRFVVTMHGRPPTPSPTPRRPRRSARHRRRRRLRSRRSPLLLSSEP